MVAGVIVLGLLGLVGGLWQLPVFSGWSVGDLVRTSMAPWYMNLPPVDVWPNLVETAEKLRRVWRDEWRLTSVYRTPEVQRRIYARRGKPPYMKSKHLQGRAADIVGPDLDVVANAVEWEFPRVIKEKDHVHVEW